MSFKLPTNWCGRSWNNNRTGFSYLCLYQMNPALNTDNTIIVLSCYRMINFPHFFFIQWIVFVRKKNVVLYKALKILGASILGNPSQQRKTAKLIKLDEVMTEKKNSNMNYFWKNKFSWNFTPFFFFSPCD